MKIGKYFVGITLLITASVIIIVAGILKNTDISKFYEMSYFASILVIPLLLIFVAIKLFTKK